MNVLVTGANGFVGSALVKRLLAESTSDIRCLVRPGSGHSRLDVFASGQPCAIEIFNGTLSSPRDCERMVEGIDLVYHLAAATGGSPAEMTQNNAVATRNLMEAIAASGRKIKIVHCSSFSVYHVAGLAPGAVIDEQTRVEPRPEKRDIYSFSKLHQEEIVRKYCRDRGIPVAIVRPGLIYGPGGTAISPRVGLILFGLFLHLGRDNLLPLTFVDNCADAIALVGKNAQFNGDIFNIVDDDLITSRQFLNQYLKEVRNIPHVTVPYTIIWALSLLCEKYHSLSGGQLPDIFTRYKTASIWRGNYFSNDKLKKLGWKPAVPRSLGLKQHFLYLQNLPGHP